MSRVSFLSASLSITVLAATGSAFAQDPTPPEPAKAEPAAPPAPAPEAPETKWYDAIELDAFVDAYAGYNFNNPRPNVNGFRAYDTNNGFSLHWAGLNATIPADPVGGTLQLRFGPSAPIYNGADDAIGLGFVKQAYASWKPVDKLTFDFGKYDQPFGSEVADSQFNLNYTRSFLYWFAQPLFFTGFRADYALSDAVDFKLFAVNGWNRSMDNNNGKSFGVQATLKPVEQLLLAVGYMGGPEQADTASCAADTAFNPATGACDPSAGAPASVAKIDGANGRLRHLADLILDFNPTKKLRFLANADYGTEKVGVTGATKSVKWWGANLVVAYALTDTWSTALRGEYYADPDGYTLGTGTKSSAIDGTLTFTYSPTKNLLFRLDGRIDAMKVEGSDGAFVKGSNGTSKTQATTTLGVVVTTN